jgi:hypothetical protein
MKRIIILCLTCFFLSQSALASDSTKVKPYRSNFYKNGFAMAGGIGAGGAVKGDFCANFSVEAQNKYHVFGLLLEGNYQSDGGFWGGSYPNDRAIQQCFYYGQRISTKKKSLTLALGASMISFEEKDLTKPVQYDWFSTTYATKTTDVVGVDILLKGMIRKRGNGLWTNDPW